MAQDKLSVDSLKQTQLNDFQYDFFANASRGYNKAMTLIVINNNLYNKGYYSYSSNYNIGLNGFVNIGGVVGASFGLGYTHERIAEDKGLFGNNGVNANWLNTDIGVTLFWFSAGMCFDVFLGSQVINKDNFYYEGVNENCFNRISSNIYISMLTRLTKLKFEGRLGFYLSPHIDSNKIAYYNMLTSYVAPTYFEIRVSYRIYTTGDRKKSPYDIYSFIY